MVEAIGYMATILVLFSFCMKDITTLRIVNLFGAVFFIMYGILILSVPVILTNSAILLINLIQLKKN